MTQVTIYIDASPIKIDEQTRLGWHIAEEGDAPHIGVYVDDGHKNDDFWQAGLAAGKTENKALIEAVIKTVETHNGRIDTARIVTLTPYDQGAYTHRGNIHDLEYYDGPLISAQMCRAKEDVPVIEVAIDNRAAETDGFTVYTRFSKEDLQTMLRMLEDPVVEKPQRCPAYSGTGERCTTCDP